MIFTEPRSDIYDLAAATEKLVEAKGPQSLKNVFARLPNYFKPTKGDQRTSLSRPPELMWQTDVRNLSRNQNPDPKYRQYHPIKGCKLIYEGRIPGVHEGLFKLGDYRLAVLEIDRKAGGIRDPDGWLIDDPPGQARLF